MYPRRQANYSTDDGIWDGEMVTRMESENEKTRRPRRRFSAEEKVRIVGLYEEKGLTRWSFAVARE